MTAARGPTRTHRLSIGLVLGVAIAASFACAATPRAANATSPYLEPFSVDRAKEMPAYRYANMTNEEAFAALDERGVAYEKVGPHGTVRAPIRLTGRLHGVDIHGALPAAQRAGSLFEVLDARLALALDDFCAILEQHDVVELVHYSMYRPNVAKPESEEEAQPDRKPTASTIAAAAGSEKKGSKKRAQGKSAKRPGGKERKGDSKPGATGKDTNKKASKDAGGGKPIKSLKAAEKEHKSEPPQRRRKWAPPGTRHPAGLAIDLGSLVKKDGSVLQVARDFGGGIGQKTCGAGAAEASSAAGRELREILCAAHDSAVFTYALTPHYDADHADHFHLEIKPEVTWLLYQ